jgi:NAD(P)-dependent dehydrogenase (short-subunit alcohol dehydrogenase family)
MPSIHPFAVGAATAAAATSFAVQRLIRRRRRLDLRGKTVVVTGGGRGLGLAISREFAARGCKLAICGRSADHVARAATELRAQGVEVLAESCDASSPIDVERFLAQVIERLGGIDVLVNNAGECFVGPAVHLRAADMDHALRSVFWTVFHPTMAVLPHMRARGAGRIVNVTSFGGKLGLPHMAAYSAAKFAATGFSESVSSELAKEGIRVSTVAPPPLRNGAPLHVHFNGNVEREFVWFAASLTSRLVGTDAKRAARTVVDAAEFGDRERAVTPLSWVLTRGHGAAPNLLASAMALVDRVMPKAARVGPLPMQLGSEVVRASTDTRVQALAEAARRQERAFLPELG